MRKHKASISLCMIVRDEERSLARCLAAAAPHVDEICIVDTGSVDATMAIAGRFGARIESVPWNGSFAAARNVSLGMATKEWVLVLDADEVLDGATTHRLTDIVDDARVLAAHLPFTNHYSGGKTLRCFITRLFRNDPSHRFVNAIHEQVMPALVVTARARRQAIVESGVAVDHYGYTDEARRDKDKDRRNRRLFEAALAAEPDNAYLWYKYADFLRRFDDRDAELTAWRRAAAAIAGHPEAVRRDMAFGAEVHAGWALELVRRDRPKEALDVLSTAVAVHRPTATFHWVHGLALSAVERWQEAIRAFEACRAHEGRVEHVPAQPGITGGRAWFGIARATLGLGDRAAAARLFHEGAERFPECGDLVRAAAQVEAGTGAWKEAVSRLMGWLRTHETDTTAWLIGGECLIELGLHDRAATWLERAAGAGSQPGAFALLAECRVAAHRLEVAKTLLSRCTDAPLSRAIGAWLSDPDVDPDASGLDAQAAAALKRFLRRTVVRRLMSMPRR